MRILALIAAAALLAGCTNMVMSEKPLFSQADGKGAPTFRQGVWASPETDCEVDLEKPMDGWPKCAHGDVMGPDGPVTSEMQFSMVMVAGDPAIVQLVLPDELRKAGVGLPGGGTGIFYAALKPIEADDDGQVTAFEGWLVECGPPPEPAENGGSLLGAVTKTPLRGLKVVGDHCIARKKSAVRNAAAASREWQKDVRVTRWVRDGEN